MVETLLFRKNWIEWTNQRRLTVKSWSLLLCSFAKRMCRKRHIRKVEKSDLTKLDFSIFCESLRWRVSQKPMDCKCRQLTMWSSLSGRSTEGGKPFVHGYRECNIPVQVKGGSLAQLSGVSPLSTGYYLSQNCSKDGSFAAPFPCGENLNGG